MNDKTNQRREDTVNNGFWDLPADERGDRMNRACDDAGVENFWNLSPEERGRCYGSVDWGGR